MPAQAAPVFHALEAVLLLGVACVLFNQALASATCYDALSVGGFHGLATSRNTTTAFGENSVGQGNVPSALAGLVVSVSAGGFHSCALHYTAAGSSSTSVSCWGGAGSSASSVPTAVTSDGGVTALAAGGYHNCAVTSSSAVVCWGANSVAQASPLPAALSGGAVTIAAGAYHSCAVATAAGGSRVSCWGRDIEGQVSGVPAALASGSGGPGLRLSCGGYHCCGWGGALASPTCWGASSAGQTSLPSSVPASSWASLCTGGRFTCGLSTGGNVSCWGSGTKGETSVPASAASNGSALAVACGWYSACALLSSGSFVCWGGSMATSAATTSSKSPSVTVATADVTSSTSASNSSGAIIISTGAAANGSSGAISVLTGQALGSGATGNILLQTGTVTGDANGRGAISFVSAGVEVTSSMRVSGNVTLGTASLTESDLAALLALLQARRATPSTSPTPSASVTASITQTVSTSPSASVTVSVSATVSPSRSVSQTVSVSPTESPSRSVSPTVSVSPTESPSRSVSPTVSMSPTTASPAPPYTVGTLAGAVGQVGSTESLTDPSAVRFYRPHGIVHDPTYPPDVGSLIVADYSNDKLRRVFFNGTTVALAGGLGGPVQLARDTSSGTVYAVEWSTHVVSSYNPTTGTVAVVAGALSSSGTADGADGSSARFHYPAGICKATDGFLYVADCGSHTLRRVHPATGATTTVVGQADSGGTSNGFGTSASLSCPYAVSCLPDGSVLISEHDNCAIRRYNITSTEVTTFAGVPGSCGHQDGAAATALFRNNLAETATDADGSVLVADRGNHVIRRIAGGVVSTVAGLATNPGSTNGVGSVARFYQPHGLVIVGRTAYATDVDNELIRTIALPPY